MSSEAEFRNDYHLGQHDRRPWGEWTVLGVGAGYCVKRIRVVPGGILSLQRHEHRAEQWTVVNGIAQVVRNQDHFEVHPAQSVGIARRDIHRVANHGPGDLVLIEVQTGRQLREDDIERIEDSYGRARFRPVVAAVVR